MVNRNIPNRDEDDIDGIQGIEQGEPVVERVERVETVGSSDIVSTQNGAKDILKGGWKQLAAVALIALIVVFGYFQFYAKGQMVSGEVYTRDMTGVVTDLHDVMAKVETKADASQIQNLTNLISELQRVQQSITATLSQKADSSQLATLTSKIDVLQSQLNSMPTKADLTQINTLVSAVSTLQSDIASLKTQGGSIETLSGKVTDLTKKIDDFSSEIKEIKEDIATGATGGSGNGDTVVTNGNFKANIVTMGSTLYPSDNHTLKALIRLDLINNTGKPAEDIICVVTINTQPIPGTIGEITLTGGTLWQLFGVGYWQQGSYIFRNIQWGLKVDTGKTKTIYLELTVNTSGYDHTNKAYFYEADVEIEAWSVGN